ncbi:MAG: hypothetical protein NDI62_02045 [Burkholderiales bacterium]|nr:hypothetical protein [Burkholderiales bacterium]
MKNEIRQCQNCKKDFQIEQEDFKFYEKIKVPPPTFCPECRLVRRLIWRNERSLYKRSCDLCNKKIIAVYDANVVFPVYCAECWKSDDWDSLKYSQEYDFKKSFFVQWRELFNKVPRPAIRQVGNCLNVEYANFVDGAKNAYLSYSVIFGSENVYYSSNIDNSKLVVDSYNITESELIYQNIGCTKNYNCKYCYWSSSCIDSNFVLDCVNCQNCFGCVNLRNKKYCIWNKEYDKDEYFEKIKNLNIGSYKFFKENFDKFWDFSLKFPRKYARTTNCINSKGDDIRNCKSSNFIFNSYGTENSKYTYRDVNSKDVMDTCHLSGELVYEFSSGGATNSQNLKFITTGYPALSHVEYSDYCGSSSYIFGCVGLRNKEYCILNKEYTKEEYFELVGKIKKQMDEMPYIDSIGNIYKYGEFFPFEFSPFGYNETVANDHFLLTKEEILKNGYSYKEKIDNKYVITKKAEEIPDDIKDVDHSILNEVIECLITKKAFKITPFELEFYRRMDIPLPRIHQDERYKMRLSLKNPMKLWHRKCMKEGCDNEFETSYAPERPEIVYCEKCYQQEVY